MKAQDDGSARRRGVVRSDYVDDIYANKNEKKEGGASVTLEWTSGLRRRAAYSRLPSQGLHHIYDMTVMDCGV